MKLHYKAITIGRFIITTNRSLNNANVEIDLTDFLKIYDIVKKKLKEYPELLK